MWSSCVVVKVLRVESVDSRWLSSPKLRSWALD